MLSPSEANVSLKSQIVELPQPEELMAPRLEFGVDLDAAILKAC